MQTRKPILRTCTLPGLQPTVRRLGRGRRSPRHPLGARPTGVRNASSVADQVALGKGPTKSTPNFLHAASIRLPPTDVPGADPSALDASVIVR